MSQNNLEQVDIDLNEFLAPNADNVIGGTEQQNNFFNTKPEDLSFLDEKPDSTETKEGDKDNDDKSGTSTVDEIIKEAEGEGEGEGTQEDNTNKAGRKKTDKSGLVEFFKKRIESKEMFAFDDYDEDKQSLDDYLGTLSEKDLDELYEANISNLKNEIAEKTPKEFFESLPEELQYAAKYVEDGGTDLKGLFQALAHVEQVRELDPTEENDQEAIIRSYLSATDFGSQEEIDEQVKEWKDLDSLGKKAANFKPKLDKLQEKIVAQRIEEQEVKKKQQKEASEKYVNNVFDALRSGELNGLKLDKNTQAKLYTGLTQPQYPSISGRPTNLLGHLLEKHQFVEPNYPLIAEALWLLSDPDEYRKNLVKNGKNAATEDIVRQLKTEQGRKSGSSTSNNDSEDNSRTKKGIPRPNGGFFKRT